MRPEIDQIRQAFAQDLREALSSQSIEALQVKYLGRKGPLQELMKLLKDVSPQEKPLLGKEINDLKVEVEKTLQEKLQTEIIKEEKQQLEIEKIDVTLPGRRRFPGRKHPITATLDHVIDILVGMGFSVQLGPDIDSDYYNFEALNFPPDHPARDMQDTFYLDHQMLLRTHTSNIQARVMESERPPIRVIAPGKVYRNETVTARSHVLFHQVEGFYVDKGVSFTDLVATFDEFLAKLFGQHVVTRYRPSYFPFVEPGMEIDVNCLLCFGKGCSVCKHTGWLEIAGAGMIHPEVLKSGDIDPEVYSGYAWGMGIERLVLIQNGIRDIRLFTENDMRFLSQFPAI